jgi:NADH-ubiquinone oxidoreductase chain 5
LNRRFLLVKGLFIFSIIFLIFRDRLLITFIGWDGLGVSSFCLILFFLNLKRQNNGVTTILRNRFGDAIFISILVFSLSINKETFFLVLFSPSLIFLSLLLIITKSAQYPFSS